MSCRKASYKTEREAKQGIVRLVTFIAPRTAGVASDYHTYRCSCGSWHFGHVVKPRTTCVVIDGRVVPA